MKERPILFSAPMVRALLDGSKTQTRRIIKPQPKDRPTGWGTVENGKGPETSVRCPYGQPGDRLWVRETWRTGAGLDQLAPSDLPHDVPVFFEADGETVHNQGKVRQSIFCMRWMSRITLEVTDVRVERLQEISEADAIAEGIDVTRLDPGATYTDDVPSARRGYRALWESINGAGSWDLNPWVWVVEFKRVES